MVLVRNSLGARKAGIRKPPVYRMIGMQLLLVVIVGFGTLLVFGSLASKSALLGGLIALLPNAYFAWRAFVYNGTREPAKVVGGIFQAELGKLLITALLFAAAFKLAQPLNSLALLLAFGSVVVGGLLGSALLLGAKHPDRL